MPFASLKNEYINAYINDCSTDKSNINHIPGLYNLPVNICFNEDGIQTPSLLLCSFKKSGKKNDIIFKSNKQTS